MAAAVALGARDVPGWSEAESAVARGLAGEVPPASVLAGPGRLGAGSVELEPHGWAVLGG